MNYYVLAGGKSSRMRQNKALLKINGETLIERVISAIPGEKESIKIVTNSPDEYVFLGYRTISDIFPHLGPISGVHAGLVDSPLLYNFFLACDLPFISEAVIQTVQEKHTDQDILGLRSRRGLEPLCAVYSKRCIPLIEKQIKRGQHSLHSLFELVKSDFIQVSDQKALANLNTPQDWRQYLNNSTD
ncbi:molybdenum cofactor guanylyltransferase [candidate division KSB1 bacterium]|nr:molybdenum cofactor guanylyltransferase [candidate division KSB1 bacterium]NIX71626.1 NTP transferase domain-containing protein [candidate division KSB1 bacterium]